MIYIRVHDSENGAVVAMCDRQLIDRILSQGDVFIDIRSYSSFYNEKLVSKEEAKSLIKNADGIYSANVVGKEAVEVALEMGIIAEGNVMFVETVPYAQAYRVDIKTE